MFPTDVFRRHSTSAYEALRTVVLSESLGLGLAISASAILLPKLNFLATGLENLSQRVVSLEHVTTWIK